MSENAIQFYAGVDSVQGGDDEVRLVLLVKDSPADLAGAVSMLGKLNRVLRVSAYLGTGADALAEFAAAIPPIKTGVHFRSNKPPVIKLDIPASDALSALRLIGYTSRLIRFEVADEGERVKTNGKGSPLPKEKKPHGDLWRELFLAGFMNCPGVMEAREQFSGYGLEVRLQMRKVFGVESLGNEVGSEEIYARFPREQYPQVHTMVEQAKRKAGVN